jgi:hypothetical protein
LYTTSTRYIPSLEEEQWILADRLRKRGFTGSDSVNINLQLNGKRINRVAMLGKDCFCEVSKIYYTTAVPNEYLRSERIHCKSLDRRPKP